MSAPLKQIGKGLWSTLTQLSKNYVRLPSISPLLNETCSKIQTINFRGLSTLQSRPFFNNYFQSCPSVTNNVVQTKSLLEASCPSLIPSRTKVRYSRSRGKPRGVKAVTDRFFRLEWGAWIRVRPGRNRQMWKKTRSRIHRLQQHVFCTKSQSKLFDKMAAEGFKKRRNYVDDPYASYHVRHDGRYFFKPKKNFYP